MVLPLGFVFCPSIGNKFSSLLLVHFLALLLLALLLWWIWKFCWSYLLTRFPSHKPVHWRTSCHVCIEKPPTKSCFSSARALQSWSMFMNGLCFCISWKIYERCSGSNFLFIVLFTSRHFLLSAKNSFALYSSVSPLAFVLHCQFKLLLEITSLF